jgi:hypothetical protein
MPSGGSQGELIACSDVREAAMTQLLDLCESDLTVREVMRRHGASRETLRSLFDVLVATDTGGSAKGHYVAASVLCSGETLDFALRNLDVSSRRKVNATLVIRPRRYVMQRRHPIGSLPARRNAASLRATSEGKGRTSIRARTDLDRITAEHAPYNVERHLVLTERSQPR